MLKAAVTVLAAPLGLEFSAALAVLEQLVPHRCHALLAAEHPLDPMVIGGEPALARHVVSGELLALLGATPRGAARLQDRMFAGQRRRVLVASSGHARSSVLLVLLPRDADPVAEPRCALVGALLDIVTLRYGWRLTAADPGYVGAARAAAGERARAISELTDIHGAALSTIVTTLRSHRLDDATARAHALDQTTEALLQLHPVYDRERRFSEEPYAELSGGDASGAARTGAAHRRRTRAARTRSGATDPE